MPPQMPGRGPPPAFVAATQAPTAPRAAPASGVVGPEVMPPKDGVFWPDNDATPAEKRALQPKYRYTSPGPEETATTGQKRKAAADFL